MGGGQTQAEMSGSRRNWGRENMYVSPCSFYTTEPVVECEVPKSEKSSTVSR